MAEIDKHFTVALADDKTLKATPVDTFDDLLVKGALPDKYRPTLYDFIANEALQFYVAGEQGAVQAEDSFVLDAGSPIFGTVAEFMKWQPGTTAEPTPAPSKEGNSEGRLPSTGGAGGGFREAASETDLSPTLKAIRLYQQLLAFHQNDEDKTAFADVDLARLVFGSNKTTGENKNDRYKTALKRFSSEWADHELAAPKIAAKLNTEVTLTGKATAYTGAAIGGAKVKWRVVREVRFPVWCWWSHYIFHGRQSSQPSRMAMLTPQRMVRSRLRSTHCRIEAYQKRTNQFSSIKSTPMSPTRPAKRGRTGRRCGWSSRCRRR